MQLILASASIGRKQLLEKLKIPFTVIPSTLDEEKIVGKNPLETLKLRARLKGEEVRERIIKSVTPITSVTQSNNQTKPYTLVPSAYLILSADSGAIIDKQLIGKPKDYRDGVRILNLLSGKTHEFVTAVYIVLKTPRGWQTEASAEAMTPPMVEETEKVWHDQDRSLVTFRKLTDEDIKLYLKNTKYTKYAGGYAIASAQNFISKIEGSVSNVIGLPLEKVIPILQQNRLL